jgi:heme A synthase
MRAFDETYRNELKLVASVQHVQNFPYDFYFGRKSDREGKEQKRSDQMIERAVRAHQRRAGQPEPASGRRWLAAVLTIDGAWWHRTAILLAAFAFLSVLTGTAVTSNPERPLYSLGQSHIWLGAIVGILTMAVGISIHATSEGRWLRVLSAIAMAAVVVQVLLGLQTFPQPPETRIAHSFIGQLFFSMTAVIAVCTSDRWRRTPERVEASSMRVLVKIVPVVVLAQVGLGALFRHGAMDVMPHLLGAFITAFFILGLALPVIYRPEHSSLRLAAQVFLVIASVQVFLGLALFSMQFMDTDPTVIILLMTIHAATGALTLAGTVVMAVLIGRSVCAPKRTK